MQNNKTPLSFIEDAIEDNKKIVVNQSHKNIEINANKIKVIKRNGKIEDYNPEKMRKVCVWAANGNSGYADMLLDATVIKLYDKIKISDVFDELIKSAVNKISRIYPIYENIAAKLYLLKYYRESWNIKTNLDYPSLSTVIEKGLHHKKYNKNVFNTYSKTEIDELNKIIDPNNDFLFTYKSLIFFTRKYCLNSSKNKKLELPQHTYMRIAMTLFYKEEKSIRLELVKKFYNYLSNHYFTVSTPIFMNAGTNNMQLSSCVLSQMGDDANSIMDTIKDIAIYSKFKGGNAVDISMLRASGSYIAGNNGISSGPVPFLKIIESTIKAFNQGSERPGVCCVYFQWWHYNFEELVVLKNNSGTEENRARQLKYSVKINDILIKRALKNEDITLFNPHDVPLLIGKYGSEFEKQYIEYENNSSLKTKKMPARQVLSMLFKERVETGNIYLFHEENVNETSLLNRYINSSNLCCEITLPSRYRNSNEIELNNPGEISLCNLASVNLVKWDSFDQNIQQDIVSILVRAIDNTIDIASYPIKEAMYTNLKYRYLGIGVLNYANYLATHKIVIDSDEALEQTAKLFDELSYQIINASLELSKEKGKCPGFDETLWALGELPITKANKQALDLVNYKPDMNKWKLLSNEIKKYGLRNAQLMAVAPTATSGKSINATESIEPIQDFIYKEDGKSNVITLAPNISQNSIYYKRAIECDQYQLIRLAAIRQCYIDQSQSINMYFKKVKSLTDFTLLHLYGFSLGIKTYYYCKTEKEEIDYVCESCT
ncbi:MAG: ribonucleoside-diphosphate reductase subunit alpha [Candidatus Ureaplasma intestinipullorum]|uniref:Ribonucleoside-diphosphate reductase n=1 Tax=Candidatus Ureaplasma intestinipullorum TaxID=2838770 RepID=A0A9E2KX06_9BACT|nr:ribonucleoside-diphosphate reductase subunit alpha [Candidatus Ureaplasma intestinipullorum]